LLVHRADEERARATLRSLLLGEAAPERGLEAPPPAAPRTWSPRTRATLLGACLVGAGMTVGALHWPAHEDGPPPPRPRPEVVRRDDTFDALAGVPDSAVPEGSGIEIFHENAPAGPGRYVDVHYARIAMRAGESKEAATARLRWWGETIALPRGARFGF